LNRPNGLVVAGKHIEELFNCERHLHHEYTRESARLHRAKVWVKRRWECASCQTVADIRPDGCPHSQRRATFKINLGLLMHQQTDLPISAWVANSSCYRLDSCVFRPRPVPSQRMRDWVGWRQL
jgi:hypothetical protein